MKKLVCVIFAIALTTACTRPDEARRVLESQGFTQVQTGGYSWFGCDEKDTFSTKFTAMSTAGKRVSGVVCSGWLKKSTVRFD